MTRVLRDFDDERVVGIRWDDNVVANVFSACKPFHEPHFVMMNAPTHEGSVPAVQLMGYGTVLAAHAGVKRNWRQTTNRTRGRSK